jgi:hypothetical protein
MTKTRTCLLVAVALCFAMPVMAMPSQDIKNASTIPAAREGGVIRLAQFDNCSRFRRIHKCQARWDQHTRECKCVGK